MKTGGFLVFFGVFWSGMTLLFDGFTLLPIARQALALRYSSTEGTVLSSELKEKNGEETTYEIKIRYLYTVAGLEHEGHQYRYEALSFSDCGGAQQVIDAHPADSKVKVFYNPLRPADAILSPGVTGEDLFQLTFMTPFNMVMLGFWRAGLATFRIRRRKWAAGGVHLRSDLKKTIARLTPLGSLSVVMATIGMAAFFSIFIVGFLKEGSHPPLHTMIITWLIILGLGIVAGAWHRVLVSSGKYDLVINELNGTLELPLAGGRKTRRCILVRDVESVYVETIRKPNNDGEASVTYLPTLKIKAGETFETEGLVEWTSFEKAKAFADWLRDKLPAKPLSLARDQPDRS